MSQITNQSLCVLGMIVAVAIIPKYVTLPEGLELLFNDKIGQLLLLGLAIAVGSYNFTCGLLLAVLFLSIMLKPIKKTHTEGFSDYSEEDSNHAMEAEEFKDEPDETPTVKKTTSTPTSTKKTKTVSMPSKKPSTEEPIMYDNNEETSTLKMPSPTPDVNQLKMELDTSQEIIKDLEKKLSSFQSKESKSTESKSIKEKNDEEPTIEPFSCGCDSDDSRVSLIKYQKANMEDTYENFVDSKNMDLFDVAGCKYDMGFKSQNDTFYGPPVSRCDTYKNINLEKTGTVFYPLN